MRIGLVVFALAWASAVAAPASAHAFLDHASPAVGSTVHAPPQQVKLWFTQELETSFSGAQVLDASGKRVDQGNARVDESDPTLITVSVPPLARGRYKVTWRVLSVDTHATDGDYTFDVAP